MGTPVGYQRKVCEVRPPVLGSDVALAVTITSAWFAVPAAWIGKQMRFEADGGIVYVGFSATTAPVIDETAVTTVTSNVIQAAGGTEAGGMIADGAHKDWTLDNATNFAFFAIKGSAVCTLRISVSSYDEVD